MIFYDSKEIHKKCAFFGHWFLWTYCLWFYEHFLVINQSNTISKVYAKEHIILCLWILACWQIFSCPTGDILGHCWPKIFSSYGLTGPCNARMALYINGIKNFLSEWKWHKWPGWAVLIIYHDKRITYGHFSEAETCPCISAYSLKISIKGQLTRQFVHVNLVMVMAFTTCCNSSLLCSNRVSGHGLSSKEAVLCYTEPVQDLGDRQKGGFGASTTTLSQGWAGQRDCLQT